MRLSKARNKPELSSWSEAGGRFEVWGWGKRRGRRQVRGMLVRAQDLATLPITGSWRTRRKKRPGSVAHSIDGSGRGCPKGRNCERRHSKVTEGGAGELFQPREV